MAITATLILSTFAMANDAFAILSIAHSQSDGNTVSGEFVAIFGGGATPEGPLAINIIASDSSIAQSFTTIAQGDGDFQILWSVPMLTPGVYTIQVVDGVETAETTIEILEPSDPTPEVDIEVTKSADKTTVLENETVVFELSKLKIFSLPYASRES